MAELKSRGITNVNFEDPRLENEMKPGHENYPFVHSLLETLAVCHTIIVEEKDGQIIYNASSPDELALVNAAKFFDYTFKGRDENNNIIVDIKGRTKKYKLLNVIEFTSTRKRMTVIIETEDGRIKVLCKGADSIIIPRLN
jgi:phospholipid-transporting ATPase